MATAMVDAYSAAGATWQSGPGLVYDRLADAVAACSPVPLAGRLVLDIGAGTGAASRAIARAGGRPLALDPAVGMLRAGRLPAVAADGRALPVASGSVGGVVAAFSFNHLDDAAVAFREAARVTGSGGPLVVSFFAADDGQHPVRDAVNGALSARGWRPPDWYDHFLAVARPRLATADRCLDTARAAGLNAAVHALRVPFPDLDAVALVAWRLGMAQAAPFVGTLSTAARAALLQDAVDRLGPRWPPLVRSILVVTAVV